jgi:formylglycine-generating enzyme required for sulfatase activity
MVELRMLSVLMLLAAGPIVSGCDDAKKAPAPASSAPAASSVAAEDSPPPPAADSAGPPPLPVVNEMVRIPGGTFTMGYKGGQKDEQPHQVTVAPFEMDVWEVTLRAYMACIDANACTYPDYDTFCVWGKKDRLDHPMNCIDWDQAAAYCSYAGKRLPTEEEWEFAARGTDGRIYPWGNDPKPPEGICFNRGKLGTCRVADVPVDSPFGLRGMAGNVWEWTASGYNETYSAKRETDRMVYRGGSFYEQEVSSLRATLRDRRTRANRLDILGFRCARSPGSKKK